MPPATPGKRLRTAVLEAAALGVPLGVIALVRASQPTGAAAAAPWAIVAAQALVAATAAGATLAHLVDGLRRRRRSALIAAGATALISAGLAAGALGVDVIGPFIALAAVAWLIATVLEVGGDPVPAASDVRDAMTVFLLVEIAIAGILLLPPLTSVTLSGLLLAAAALYVLAGLLRDGSAFRGGSLLLGAAAAVLALAEPGSVEVLVGYASGALAMALAASAGVRSEGRAAELAAVAHPVLQRLLPPVATAVNDGILLFDSRLRLRDWNEAATDLLRIDERTAGKRLADVLGITYDELQRGAGRAMVETGPRSEEPLELHAIPHGDGMMVVAHEPTDTPGTRQRLDRLGRELRGTTEELLQARRVIELQRGEIERAASVDPLTGVASRNAILDRLRVEVSEARRYAHSVAIALVDVDGMAVLNHVHGLEVGDAVLRELALRIRLRVREADALGRSTGDAFLAVMPHTDEGGAATFADALRRRLAHRPIATTAGAIPVTISVGIAVMRPADDLHPDGLLARAEEALASARAAGGDCIALDRSHGLARLDGRDRPRSSHQPAEGSPGREA